MKFWTWVYKKIRDAGRAEESSTKELGSIAAVERDDSVRSEHRLSFELIPAEGGWIISRRKYDPQTDNTDYKLQLVHENDDMAKAIGEFVQMECLRGF